MPGTLGLLTDSVLALHHGLLQGHKLQCQPKLVCNAAQFLFRLGNVHLPITVPYSPCLGWSRLGIHASNAGAGAIEPFFTIEVLSVHIAQRDMRHPQIVHKPRAVAVGTRNALPKEGQLKAEPVAVRRLYISGVVPPLGLVVLMVEVVSRKLESILGLRDFVVLRGGASSCARSGEKQKCNPVIPHALPPWDPTAPQAAPDRAPPAPWQHTPRLTTPGALRQANETELSSRTIVC